MNDFANPIQRKPRYLVIDQSAMELCLEKSGSPELEIDVELLDISSGGAKVRTTEKVPEGKRLALKLHARESKVTMCVDATVRWNQLARGGEWVLGCSFEPSIPGLVLEELAQSGVLDRRDDQREEIFIPTTAAWQLATGSESVCIINISQNGFCLLSQEPGKPGSQVLLKFPNSTVPTTISGRCRWQVETQAGFTLGCEFTSIEDFAALRRIQTETAIRLSAPNRSLFQRLLGG